MLSYSTFASFSYAIGGLLYLALAGLLLTGWRGRLQGGLLIGCTLTTFLWCAVTLGAIVGLPLSDELIAVSEVIRNGFWLLFFARLQGLGLPGERGSSRNGYWLLSVAAAMCAVSLLVAVTDPDGRNRPAMTTS